jgi:hypothetical protein
VCDIPKSSKQSQDSHFEDLFLSTEDMRNSMVSNQKWSGILSKKSEITTLTVIVTTVENMATKKRIVGRRSRIMEKRFLTFAVVVGMVEVVLVVDVFEDIWTVAELANSHV